MIIKSMTICGVELELRDDSVFNKITNKEIPVHLLSDGQRFLLVDGEKINYGVLKLFAFNKCYLPFKHWDGCKVGFHDKDSSNYRIENLYIIFPKGGIESTEKRGYRYIPGYELNLINEKGVLYRRKDNSTAFPTPSEKLVRENKWYYKVYVDKTHSRRANGRHNRLMALAWCNPPDNYPELVTDHLNNIKTDNRPENLEWVTYQENSIRALEEGLHTAINPVLVKDKETGEIKEYRSLMEASKLLGFVYNVFIRAKRRPNQTHRNRYVIKDKDDETPWETYETTKAPARCTPVKARCVETGEVSHYVNFADAERKTGLTRRSINDYFKFFKNPYILRGYEWKLEDDDTPWFEFNEYDLEKERRGMHARSCVYELHDIITDETHICYGWKEASVITGIGQRNILKAVQDNIIIKGRFKIKVVSS